VQQGNNFIIFRPQMQTVHIIGLSSPRAPPGFHIEDKALAWLSLSCAGGVVFGSSCPCSAIHILGQARSLPLTAP